MPNASFCSVKFTGEGSVRVYDPDPCPVFEEEGYPPAISCEYVNTQIFPDIKAPIDVTPYHPWEPWLVFLFDDDCASRSETPLYTIEDFRYTHNGSSQSLSLNIINFSNGGVVNCTVPLNETQVRAAQHDQEWVECEIPAGAAKPKMIFKTEVAFNKDYGTLFIKQDYACPFEKSKEGVKLE
jgi:hypothetical protein